MALHPSIEALLAEIDAFRAGRGMNATAFGLAAVNDGKFLSDLQHGRIPSLPTIDKVRVYMAAEREKVRCNG